jgi:hypothetical protein
MKFCIKNLHNGHYFVAAGGCRERWSHRVADAALFDTADAAHAAISDAHSTVGGLRHGMFVQRVA